MIRVIIDAFRNGEPAQAMIALASLAMILLVSMPVHEFAHAWTAHKLGDDTARLAGRMTVNPSAHLSLLGSLMIIIAGFGFAKPVPVNINNLKNGKSSFALVSVAGPISNLIMGFAGLIFLEFFNAVLSPSSTAAFVVYLFFLYFARINISLAVFNLIPLPPLDGSRLLGLVIPDKYYYLILKYERYIMIAVLLLLYIGVLDRPLSWLTGVVYGAFDWIAKLMFAWIR